MSLWGQRVAVLLMPGRSVLRISPTKPHRDADSYMGLDDSVYDVLDLDSKDIKLASGGGGGGGASGGGGVGPSKTAASATKKGSKARQQRLQAALWQLSAVVEAVRCRCGWWRDSSRGEGSEMLRRVRRRAEAKAKRRRKRSKQRMRRAQAEAQAKAKAQADLQKQRELEARRCGGR